MASLDDEAERLGIRPPTPATLRRYGLTATDWLVLLKDQGWKCAICLKRVKTWNTDHDHTPGWKLKPPAERAKYVRGVLCWYCNHRKVGQHRDPDEVQRIADYLRAYLDRRNR